METEDVLGRCSPVFELVDVVVEVTRADRFAKSHDLLFGSFTGAVRFDSIRRGSRRQP